MQRFIQDKVILLNKCETSTYNFVKYFSYEFAFKLKLNIYSEVDEHKREIAENIFNFINIPF